jgi:hypothetical protein
MALTEVQTIAKIANIPAINNGKKLAFPEDLGTPPFNYWMSLSFYEYQRPTITNINDFLRGTTTVLNDLGTIRLPIPNSLIDHQEQDYSTESFGIVSGMAAAALAVAGEIANPLLAIMYRAPAFKSHNFMWRLAPTKKTESETLNSIINTIKFNQLPKKNLNSFGLKYPNIVQMTLSCVTSQYFSYVFKPAIIKSFDVNYTPEGQPSFFGSSATGDAAPTVVEIRMTTTEIEYFTQSDFG